MATDVSRIPRSRAEWMGRPLTDWLPDVIADIVKAVDPLQVIVFGSAARGETDVGSDIDILVVLAQAPFEERWKQLTQLHAAIHVPAPVDIVVTDPDEIASKGHLTGSILHPALQEGIIVHERAA